MADMTYPAAHGQRPGHLATPTGQGQTAAAWPGVVVINEAFGLTDDIRAIADRLAEHGYLACAPDFFADRAAGWPRGGRSR